MGVNTMKKIKFQVVGVYDKYSSNEVENMKKVCDKFIYNFKELL